MIRQIKFRGKRIDNGAWETGGVYIPSGSDLAHMTAIIDKRTGYHTSVDPDTVGQFTGLKDKNGVEIYEGDVVKCRWLAELGITEIDCEAVGIVNWQDEICMFYIGFAKPFITHPCEDGRYAEDGMALEKTVDGFTKNDFSIDYEVIGNIHDNPELLGGAE